MFNTSSVPAPKEILDLVARFELHLDAYKSGQYNETQLRRAISWSSGSRDTGTIYSPSFNTGAVSAISL